jgi:hypothetical protein
MEITDLRAEVRNVQPGDVLVLTCPGKLTEEQRRQGLRYLRERIDPRIKVLILDKGMSLDLIRIDVLVDNVVHGQPNDGMIPAERG